MAGFFGLFNYAKPGKGVDKNTPQKHRIFLFFELYFRKFFKLLQLNIMYFVVTFPFFAFAWVNILSLLSINIADFIQAEPLTELCLWFLAYLPPFVVWPLVAVSAVLFGPATAAMTYILRNFAREEHAWVWSDFWERLRKNFKQGLLAGALDILICLSFVLYMTASPVDDSLWSQYLQLFKYVAIIIFIIYNIMRFYIYTLIVTFDMTFMAMLRNAWLFVILGIVRNLCTVLFSAIAILAISIMPIATMPLLAYSLLGFITVFNAYPTIYKFMMDPKEREPENGAMDVEYLDEPEDGSIFSDDVSLKNKEENQ